jgi:asparagine synthase (glutamine-hydrolysing)
VSGLCGWYARDPAALPIGQMAAALARFDQEPLRTALHGAGAVAAVGSAGAVGLYQSDGMLIAHWGGKGEEMARLWRTHGVKACEALSGHFAFALLDERRGEALLAVDRCATRPLFYRQFGHTLLFATSLDALLSHPGAGRDIDPQALYSYLHFLAVPGPGSMYKEQRRLAPGEYLHLQGGRAERRRYWRLRFQERAAGPLPELRDELLDALRSTVAASGGQGRTGLLVCDAAPSAALEALMRQASSGAVPAHAAGAAHPGERMLSASEAVDAIPVLAAAQDQPCGAPAALAAYHHAHAARGAGLTRLVADVGGAVLFGAHAACARQRRLARYERLPAALRQLVLEPLLYRVAGEVRTGPLAALREHIDEAMTPSPMRLQANPLDGYGAAKVLDPEILAQVDPSAPGAAREQAWWLAQTRDDVNRMIAVELQYGLIDRALPALATAAQLAGVELAFPYLDDAVVAFAARLPVRYKRDGDAGLLGAALRRLAPGRVASLGRRGLGLPVALWLRSDQRFRAFAFDSLLALRSRRIVRAAFVDELTALPRQHAARHGQMVWLLMMLEQWFAQHRPQMGAEPKARGPAARRACDEVAS